MAQLRSLYGGKPGRPGDPLRGIPPRLPQPPKPPRPPKAPKPPKPVGQKKTDSRETKTVDDEDEDYRAERTQG